MLVIGNWSGLARQSGSARPDLLGAEPAPLAGSTTGVAAFLGSSENVRPRRLHLLGRGTGAIAAGRPAAL